MSRSLVEFVDLYPTVADFCGLKVPHKISGVSLNPLLDDPGATVKDAAFTLVTRGQTIYGQSIRTNRWRFTRWSDGQIELYDHENDLEEFHDLSLARRDIVTTLSDRLERIPKP